MNAKQWYQRSTWGSSSPFHGSLAFSSSPDLSLKLRSNLEMDCHLLHLLVFLTLGMVVVSHGDQLSPDIYWKSVLPKTPMPKAIRDALEDKSSKSSLGHGNIGFRGRASYKYGMDNAELQQSLANSKNVNLYFLEQDIKEGKTMTLDFSTNPSTKSVKFLPRQEVEKIPFSSKKLPEILKHFSVKPGSVEAQTIENTLKNLEQPTTKGKVGFVATSLESMVDYATSKMRADIKKSGVEVKIEADSTQTEIEVEVGGKKAGGIEVEVEVHTDKIEIEIEVGGSELEVEIPLKNKQYTVKSGSWKITTDAILCEKQKYPHAVFYCHMVPPKTSAYMVPLEGAHGMKVKALALCHADTSDWNPNHDAFKVLKIERGTVPVCRFLPEDHIVWSRKN